MKSSQPFLAAVVPFRFPKVQVEYVPRRSQTLSLEAIVYDGEREFKKLRKIRPEVML